MRRTIQRDAVLRVLAHTNQHPTAEWIHQEVRKQLPRISLGTVYRLLNHLVEEGRVRELTLEEGPKRYDAQPGNHQHAICTECGKIVDVPEMVLPQADVEVERKTGYRVSHLSVKWYGQCAECQNKVRPSPR
ncbi:MAG TPA: transcriptional repressor [Chthonomonadales bacterium]|nr:transcriptional repressor [Chthonomonadales bacterium]